MRCLPIILPSLLSLFIPMHVGAQVSSGEDSPRQHRMRFCGFGGNGELLDALSAMWPNLDYCRAYDQDKVSEMAALSSEARQRSMLFSLQAAGPVVDDDYLDRQGAWALDFLNRKPPELGFGHPVADYCHPATIAAIKENIDTAITGVGAKSFTMVDFVWPWVGGQWGYSKSCFKAYRAALDGTDGGLKIRESGNNRTMSFWDYFAELSGLRFTPADLGMKTWNDYEPVRPNLVGDHPTDFQKRNQFVYRGLIHWCWLKYAQEAGSHAKSLGGELQASLNPENMANGTDLLSWGRLQDTGTAWWEQWGSPMNAITGYHTYRYFSEPYRGNKRLGLIGETAAAGGHPDSGFGPARPHYWDPNSNHAITWAISAAGQFDDREEDYIWASPEETFDPAGPHADCWRGEVKAMDGFWQYALDSPSRPIAPILSIVNRSILHETDNSEQSVSQKFSLAPALVDLHIDFEQASFPFSDNTLAGRKILLFAPWDYPRDVLPRLRKWLREDPAHMLVTHSFVPTRPCKGLDGKPNPTVDEPDAAKELGLQGIGMTSVSEGKIDSIDPGWTKNFTIAAGTHLKLDRPLTSSPGKALITLDGHPLVSLIESKGGGSVIYLNFTPPERHAGADTDTSRLYLAVIEMIARKSGIKAQAKGSADWACARYDVAGGHTYFLLDRRRVEAERFTEETSSMDPASKLSLTLEPDTRYLIHDQLAETVASRRTNVAGELELFLSGRSLKLLHVTRQTDQPQLLFTNCEKSGPTGNCSLPAALLAHRAGKAIVSGIPSGSRIYLNGNPAASFDTALADCKTVMIPKGEHRLEIRKD